MKTNFLSLKLLFLLVFSFEYSWAQVPYTIVSIDSKYSNVALENTLTLYSISLVADPSGCVIKARNSSGTPNTDTQIANGQSTGTFTTVWNSNSSGTLTFTVSGCTNTTSANGEYTITYPILNAPANISGSNSIACGIQTLTYSVNSVVNATSYEWTYPSNWSVIGSSTSNSITLQTDASSSGDVTVRSVNGSVKSNIKSLNVSRVPFVAPTVVSYGSSQGVYGQAIIDRILCSSTTFEVTGGNATSYLWETTGGVSASSTSSTATVSASSDGSIKIYPVSQCGTGIPYALINIKVGAPGTPSFTADGDGNSFVNMCAGNSKYLVVNSDKANSFSFQLLNGSANLITTGSNSATFNTYNTGTFRVEAKATNCFGNGSNTKYINVINCSSAYRIGPNPASSTMTITYDETTPIDLMPDNIKLIDSKSNEHISVNIKDKIKKKEISENKIELDVNKLPRGEYYLHILNNNHPDKDKKMEKVRVILQ